MQPVERAQNRPTTPEMLEKNLTKTGGTPFFVQDMKIELPEGLMVPASRINALRKRFWKSFMTAMHKCRFGRGIPTKLHQKWSQNVAFQGYNLEIRHLHQITDCMLQNRPHTIYVPLTVLSEQIEVVKKRLAEGFCLAVQMPRVYTDKEQPEILRMLEQVQQIGVGIACAMNVGQVLLLRRMGFVVHGGFGLNVCNGAALEALSEQGVTTTLSLNCVPHSCEILQSRLRPK